ncbi:flagellar hook-associated protein FlgK [Desulfonatronovibrio magnus]|uniref:flagellar hook-associated protein FlgK n=1 Tax=Desulfonatronovibrio magnus TaxID=698827 RepID=UPI0005EBB620|nr:flagellar hook-associated protein FlgK [Desulfonatronovibrio magnus]
MPGLTSLLHTGRSALFANQTAMQVVGNNVANANTPGYRRQAVRLEESFAIDYKPGQIGTGVNAKEVYRYFDSFIEAQYNSKSSEREMWQTLQDNLSNVEILFNESREGGLNKALAEFWSDWQDLSRRPEDNLVRSALVGKAYNLSNTINRLDDDLTNLQTGVDKLIEQDVNRVNDILKEITAINKEISVGEIPGRNNLNQLRDKRDMLVRELAEKIDISYIDNGGGNVSILTKAGHTLVDGPNHFKLAFESGKTFANLTSGSAFDGQIDYKGSSSYEITVEVVDGGNVDANATFRVSLDGGKTWLQDDAGNDREFAANGYDNRVILPVDGVEVWFNNATQPLSTGDRFEIIPKSGLYWYENTSSAMHISPQILSDGQMNERRITGGSLAGYMNFRDHYAGKYREKLDATASTLAWEVNRIHSQGAGLEMFQSATGTYQVVNNTVPLASDNSGLFFRDKLQNGNLTVFVYDSNGDLQGSESLDFGGGQGFDPETHSFTDIVNALNAINGISAQEVNGKVVIDADAGNKFVFGNDTSGLLAALGVNTFFQGHDAGTFAANDFTRNNIAFINAGHVNGAGEANAGDNKTALDIAGLQHKKVSISTFFEGTTEQSIQDYYNSLVGNVGADTSMTKFSADYNKALTNDLNRRQEEISGVNMDEEMSDLIKYQNSYQAAAKLITTADRMLQVLLGMKN